MKKLFVIILFVVTGCSQVPRQLTGYDIELFEGTEVWKLAKAVKKEDTAKIKYLIRSTNINFPEHTYGMTLLQWAVFNKLFLSAKTLLESGADPNIRSNDGESALILGAYEFETSDYVKLLLKYGADVNAIADYKKSWHYTPLMSASSTRLESVKILVAAGANVNYETPSNNCAIVEAALAHKIYIVRYLMIDCHAEFKNPPGVTDNLLSHFNGMSFRPDSPEYKIEMELLEYMKQQGVDSVRIQKIMDSQ